MTDNPNFLNEEQYPYVTVWHDSGSYYYVDTRHSSITAAERAARSSGRRVVDLRKVHIIFRNEANARVQIISQDAFCQ